MARRNFYIATVAICVAVVAALGAAVGLALLQRREAANSKVTMQQIEADVAAEVVVPAGVVPAAAQVSDTAKLSAYPFFSDAQDGDVLLVYSGAAGKTVLYRPSIGKIVAVSSFLPSGTSGVPTPTPTPTAIPSVAIYNGTHIFGLATKAEEVLQSSAIHFTTVEKIDARHQYTQTIVVDLTDQFPAAASAMAIALNGSIGQLPAGEASPPGAGILIILGREP